MLPSLRFVTLGEVVEAEWQSLEIVDAGIRFLTNGVRSCRRAIFEATLSNFVDAVVTRLDDMGLSQRRSTISGSQFRIPLLRSRSSVKQRHGLASTPTQLTINSRQGFLDVARRIRPELLNDFLSLASVDQLADQESELASAAGVIASDTDPIDAIIGVRSRAPSLIRGANAWESGYRYAERASESERWNVEIAVDSTTWPVT